MLDTQFINLTSQQETVTMDTVDIEHFAVVRRRDYLGSPCIECEEGSYVPYGAEHIYCKECDSTLPRYMTKAEFFQIQLEIQESE
jgi:hypothetical protein